jgi:hypothetical protein
MTSGFKITLASVAIGIAALSAPASAAECSKSCTALKNGCIKAGGNPAACSAGYSECKRTGTYGGMPSGKTWTNICKK